MLLENNNNNNKQLQMLAGKKLKGFNRIETYCLCVSAAVLYQLSYEDPYVGSRPIYQDELDKLSGVSQTNSACGFNSNNKFIGIQLKIKLNEQEWPLYEVGL